MRLGNYDPSVVPLTKSVIVVTTQTTGDAMGILIDTKRVEPTAWGDLAGYPEWNPSDQTGDVVGSRPATVRPSSVKLQVPVDEVDIACVSIGGGSE